MPSPSTTPSTPACAPARPRSERPRVLPPPDACDCHYHIFGPYETFPLDATRTYTPPAASLDAFRQMQDTLGLRRSVIVQPSVYGTDNRCTMDAVQQLGRDRTRAVVVIDDMADSGELARLASAGACGVRINAVTGNGTPVEQMTRIARLVAPLGWHMQLYMDVADIAGLTETIMALPVPVVIDHMGHLDPRDGTASPGFRALLRLLGHGHIWAKLCGYRCSREDVPYADMAPFARAMADAAPDRCVWGTDWPHPTFKGVMPDDGALLDALMAWLPDPAVQKRVFVDNPARLYGFTP